MYKHLKYGLPMINDVVRNRFYKKILKDTKNKNCLEIGFGTGILSILALEAGANHIVAYEENLETYQLGLEVIQSLGLENKIELIGQEFRPENIHRHKNIDYIFTETINHTLFGETMLKAVNGPLPEILPNIYFLEVYAIPISDNYAKRLINNDKEICNPGLEITEKFSAAINRILNKSEVHLEDGLHGIAIDNIHQVLEACEISNILPAHTYTVDINKPVTQEGIDWNVELENNENYLFIFRTGIQYKEHRLYTDVCDNWGPFAQYALIINSNNSFRIEQNFADGNFTFSYNDQKIYLIKEEHKHNYDVVETEKIKVVNFVH
jgi:hypothetical protein